MIMKLQKILYLPLLALASTCYAADPGTLDNKTNTLNAAKNALSTALGLGGNDNNGQREPLADQVVFTHKNATNIPVVVSFVQGDIAVRQQILAGGTYNQNASPKDSVGISVHADLSPIFANYDATASYDIVINANGDLELQKNAEKNGVIVNKTLWPMALSFDLKNNNSDETILNNTQRYSHKKDALNVTITPLIEDLGQPVAIVKAWTIANDNGDLDLK
jgi:hypothetical protein